MALPAIFFVQNKNRPNWIHFEFRYQLVNVISNTSQCKTCISWNRCNVPDQANFIIGVLRCMELSFVLFFFLRNLQVNIGERHMHEYMLHTTINIQRCIYGCNSKPPHRWRPWAGSSISRRIFFFWIWIFDVTRRAFFVFPRMTVLDFDAENRRPTSV